MKTTAVTISNEAIIGRIFFIRGRKVMFDRDLAGLYGIETKVLNQAVKRNIERFPDDFMFRLDEQEAKIWREHHSRSRSMTLEGYGSVEGDLLRSQIVTSKTETRGGRQYSPIVFTEQGVAMLSSVLKSPRAIEVNIQIIRTFTKLREILADNKKLGERLEEMERKYDKKIADIFAVIKYLVTEDAKPFQPMGFNVEK